jgi:Glycosyl hydrolases family 16/Carbohydrate binding module (family 6)/Ricin-type beta-trefoil lectin domain-like
MKNRFLQSASMRFTLCVFALLTPLASLRAQDSLTTGTPFNIVNENSGLCVGASAQGTANGTALEMYTCANGTYSSQLSQEWIFTSASSGFYEAADANATAEAWNVVGNGTTSGSLMQIWSYSGNANEEFDPESLGNGYYKFVGEGSGLCLDVPGNSTANSAQLDIYTCNGTTAQAFKLVTPSASSGEGPYGGTSAAVPGTVQAENYDTGGQGVGYSVSSTNGTGNNYRSDGVDLEVTTDTGGGYDLGWTASGQYFRYTVNVETAGAYTVTFRVSAPGAVNDAFHLSNSSGTDLSGTVNVPATGGYQAWTNVTATVTLPAGEQTLTLNQDNAAWNINYFSFASGSSSNGGTGACSGVSNISVGGTTYTPTWCQEFTGSAGPPSTTAWKFDLGNNSGWGNGEVEVYCGPPGYPNNPSQCPTTFSTSTSPVYIDGNGHLVIQPRNVGGTWLSGRMNTEGIQNFQYGILEASIQLPNTTNEGLWPAFWTLGSDITTVPWPTSGEADIMENWSPQVDGGAGTAGNNSTVHTAKTGGDGVGGRYTFPSGQATDTAFHTYGIVWTPNEMQFFVDNASTPFFTVTPSSLPSGDTWPFNADLFTILNVAIGGTLGGSTSGLTNPGPMTVDYVRYYTAQ